MQDKAERNRIAVNVWTARIIPIVLVGVVGYATYVLVALLCGTFHSLGVGLSTFSKTDLPQ